MQEKLIFLIGPPRSGSTLLMRMLSSHSQIYSRPEPHLLTPLAHLGYWDNVDRAPFDQLQAASSLKGFVQDLPGGEADYIEALQAYAHTLYGKMIATQDKPFFLDKTPAYGLILPFLAKVFPKAHFVVLTRNPCSVWDSYAESFFDGDYEAARDFNPIITRYVPAMADFMRTTSVPFVHVRYEDVVSDPETQLKRIYEHIGLPHEPESVEYGQQKAPQTGLGDPIGVGKHSRPVTSSLEKWATGVAAVDDKEVILRQLVDQLDARDVETWGYDKGNLFEPLERVDVGEARNQAAVKRRKDRWNKYKMRRRLLVWLRRDVNRSWIGKRLKKIRLVCEVILRGDGNTGWNEEASRRYGDKVQNQQERG
ncbi:MAG: sulfotransferase [Myxococcota bacterium]|nr:sulfotransferase [Myxococcota bacterium]